jgi:hypothetical protein
MSPWSLPDQSISPLFQTLAIEPTSIDASSYNYQNFPPHAAALMPQPTFPFAHPAPSFSHRPCVSSPYAAFLLNCLPDRFGSFVDSIWTAEKDPSIEDIKISILRVNAGQLNRSNEKALAARKASLSLDSTTSLSAFYTGLKKSGKKPSKAHPCARCGSPTHWVVDCTKPTDANENSNNNKK